MELHQLFWYLKRRKKIVSQQNKHLRLQKKKESFPNTEYLLKIDDVNSSFYTSESLRPKLEQEMTKTHFL
jgi:hypothetical protein